VTTLKPRPGILNLEPYVGGQSSLPGVARVIKLSSNESALGASPLAVQAIKDAASHAFRYPDGGCMVLREQLARSFRLNPDNIVCGAGSDELFSLLARAYVGPGDEVLYTRHGFLMYPIVTHTVGGHPIAVSEKDLTTDVDALLARVTERTRIVFLANPNNPTGTYVPDAEIRRLRLALPDHVLLVIDAAYAEYVDRPDYGHGFDWVDESGRVVVTRTFSKVYGLGGIRLGWGYCPPDVADVLNRLRNPFNVSGAAQTAGIAALNDQGFVERSCEHNSVWRDWVSGQLRGLGLEVGDSVCNFLLVRFPREAGRDAECADTFLKQRGIITRRMGSYKLPECLRITIGREDEMQTLVDALRNFVGSWHD